MFCLTVILYIHEVFASKKTTMKVMNTSQWNKVSDLRKVDETGWNEVLIREVCDEESANAFLNMVWSIAAMEDRLYWCGNKNDIFSVKSCFAINFQLTNEDQSL